MKHIFKQLFAITLLTITGLQAAQPQKLKEATPPFTVTVKQTGEVSWKTLYKVPVEISITNNTDKDVNVVAPCFNNASLWNKNMFLHQLAWLCKWVGLVCIGAGVLSVPAYGIKSLGEAALAFRGKDAPRFAFECCETETGGRLCGSSMTPVITKMNDAFWPGVGSFLLSVVLRWLGSTKLNASETITISGSMNVNDVAKVQNKQAEVFAVEQIKFGVKQ
jgi:hypothetical protein